jgi:hypothetical protein
MTDSMTDKEFKAFMATLVPMATANGGKGYQKLVNANYKKVLAMGFRYSRKENCYAHPSGRKIATTSRVRNGKYECIWAEIK